MIWMVRLCAVLLSVLSLRARVISGANQNVSKVIVENLVKDAIGVVSHSIAVAGFDPFHVTQSGFSVQPIAKFLSFTVFAKSVVFNGASHIAVNNVTFTHSTLTLFLDLSLPLLYFSVGEACADVEVVDKHFNASVGGSLILSEVRIQFAVVLKVQKSGIALNNITMDFSIGDVASDFNAQILGKNVSEPINDLFNNQVPLFIKIKQKIINDALGSLIGALLKEILGT